MAKLEAAPDFEEMLRERGPITLGDARTKFQKLSEEEQKAPCCGCYCVKTPKGIDCCSNFPLGPSFNCAIGGCMWYCCFMAVCKAADGTYNCGDLKGNQYTLVKVEKNTWAWFSQNEVLQRDEGEDLKVGCYFERLF